MQAAGYLPGTRSALRQWDVSEADRAALRGILEAAVPPPQPEVMAIIGPAMQDALEAVLRGQATPKRAAADAIESLEQSVVEKPPCRWLPQSQTFWASY
jgi:maltose-binding protein MalE